MGGLVILCPGQGGQHPEMFRLNPEYITHLEPYLTSPFLDVMNSPTLPFKNQNAQVLVVASSFSNWLAIKSHVPKPTAFLGYSVGEMTAFACAGATPQDDILMLVQKRAHVMDDVKAKINFPMGLMAVTGFEKNKVVECCDKYGIFIAITINTTSFVLGGFQKQLELAHAFITLGGAHAHMLPIDVASHTPLMKEASVNFHNALEEMQFREHFNLVISSLTGEKITAPAKAKSLMAEQLSHPLDFENCFQVVRELLPDCVLELGPGNALSKMFQKHNARIPCRSVDDFRTIQGVTSWVLSELHPRC